MGNSWYGKEVHKTSMSQKRGNLFTPIAYTPALLVIYDFQIQNEIGIYGNRKCVRTSAFGHRAHTLILEMIVEIIANMFSLDSRVIVIVCKSPGACSYLKTFCCLPHLHTHAEFQQYKYVACSTCNLFCPRSSFFVIFFANSRFPH